MYGRALIFPGQFFKLIWIVCPGYEGSSLVRRFFNRLVNPIVRISFGLKGDFLTMQLNQTHYVVTLLGSGWPGFYGLAIGANPANASVVPGFI